MLDSCVPSILLSHRVAFCVYAAPKLWTWLCCCGNLNARHIKFTQVAECVDFLLFFLYAFMVFLLHLVLMHFP